MTDKIGPTMETTGNRRTSYVLSLAAVLVLSAGFGLAEESENQRSSFIIDSKSDRTPAITAFPKYPRIARRDRIEGEAIVCFKVSLDGRIRSVRTKSYSNRIFRRPALRAIKGSSFEALRPHEILSTARTCRTYRFRLEPVQKIETT